MQRWRNLTFINQFFLNHEEQAYICDYKNDAIMLQMNTFATHNDIDLCGECAKDFKKFMEKKND